MLMNLQEIANFIEMIEKKYPIQNWKIDEINIWPLVRLRLKNRGYMSVKNTDSISNHWLHQYKFLKNLLKNNINVVFKDRKHNQKISNASVLFLGNSVDRNVLMPDGGLINHNIDPIRICLENRGIKTMCVEECASKLRLPRGSDSYIVDKLLLKTLLVAKLSNMNYDATKCNLIGYNEFLVDLEKRGETINDVRPAIIMKQIWRLRDLSNMFIILIKKIKPKVVILVDWQSSTSMALTLAAHKLHIPVIEIQHGVAASGGKENITYSNWLNIPKGGYELVPDYMWVWNQDDYLSMVSWATESWRPVIGGHPMNLIWADSNSSYTHYYQKIFDSKYKKNKPVILFTLQWGMSYPGWIIEFINTHSEYIWLIRKHPVVDDNIKNFVLQLEGRNNIIISSVDLFPLEILLINVNLHITMYSSVVIDAETFLCPSIILHPKAKQFFNKQVNNGIAYYADNTVDLKKAINFIISRSKEKLQSKDLDNIYTDGCNAIDKVISIIDNAHPIWGSI